MNIKTFDTFGRIIIVMLTTGSFYEIMKGKYVIPGKEYCTLITILMIWAALPSIELLIEIIKKRKENKKK